MDGRQCRNFPEAFKREAAYRVGMSALSAGAVARKLGPHKTVLRRFTIYAEIPKLHLVPAYLDDGLGGEVIAVFVEADDERLAYLMQMEWRGSHRPHSRLPPCTVYP
jgi:hypothetical protein